MVFMNRKSLILVALALSCLTEATTSLQAKTKNAHAVNVADQLINEAQKQLAQIRICLNSIAALIRKNNTYTEKEQQKIITHFLLLDQMIIEKMKNEKFLMADLQQVHALLLINTTLINHIHELLASNFKTLASFKIEQLIAKATRRTKKLPEKKQIDARLAYNDKKLEALKDKSLGLTWYNEVSRFLDNRIISPCQKYSIPSRTLLVAGTLFAGSVLWWQIFTKHFKRVMKMDENTYFLNKFGKFKHWIGNTLYGEPYGKIQSPESVSSKKTKKPLNFLEKFQPTKPKGLLGRLDYHLYNWIHSFSETSRWLAKAVAAGLGAEFLYFYPKTRKQLTIWKNWLKGGTYLKEAERAAEKVEHVRFEEIFGQNEIKRYLQILVDYLEKPESFDRLGLTPPKGILCIGDTRTGKTFCINAFFGEVNDMFARTGQPGKFKLLKLDVLTIKVEGMEKILRMVKRNAPCIVFIDEIDLLDLQRTGENRTLSEFLTAMGDVVNSSDSKKQVIIIAATNRPETLDIALRQPGRFGKELRFEYPNYQDRVLFMKTRLAELSLTIEAFDVEKLAKYTENKSYEALNMLIKNAIIKSRLRGEVLTQQHLDEALDEDIYHIIPKYTKDVPAHELNILSAHFAGQALMLALLDNDINLAKVTIRQVMTELKEEVMGMHLYGAKEKKEQERFEYGKIFTHHKHDSINMATKEEKIEMCKMYLAGFIAEELLLGSCGYSCHAEDDKANALGLAQSIAFEGIDMSTMPKHVQNEKHNQALAIIEQCKKEVREVLTKNKEALTVLSQALVYSETLDHDQVVAIVKNHKEIAKALESAEQAASQEVSATA